MRAAARSRAVDAKNVHGVEPDRASVRTALDRVFGGQCSVSGYEGDTRGAVENSQEFRRVHDLPRSDWRARTDLQELVSLLTEEYRTPAGTMTLRPIQAATLETLHNHRGAFGAIGVGEGKTLITYLAPLVMGSKRPLLIVPAKLKEKTIRDFAALAKDWRKGADVEVISYEWLSRVNAADFLTDFDPDLISCDEVHRIKNASASCTRRVVRHLRERPEVVLLALSGTVASRSLMDFHHLLALTSPVPGPGGQTVGPRGGREMLHPRAAGSANPPPRKGGDPLFGFRPGRGWPAPFRDSRGHQYGQSLRGRLHCDRL